MTMYVLGGSPGVAEQAIAIMQARHPRLSVVGFHHGYFEKTGAESEAVVSQIRNAQPDILVVGFGMPTQEHWIARTHPALSVPVILPCGSMIDYVAGRKTLAPGWMSNHGMEWLFRLFQEPGRLWKRYLIGNPLFMFRILMQWAKL